MSRQACDFKSPKFSQTGSSGQDLKLPRARSAKKDKHYISVSVVTCVCLFMMQPAICSRSQKPNIQVFDQTDFFTHSRKTHYQRNSMSNTHWLFGLHPIKCSTLINIGRCGLREGICISELPVCAWAWPCCSCRLWLSTEIPLSLCSFSPSGEGVWFWLAVQLLAPCLFCLQLFHLIKRIRVRRG